MTPVYLDNNATTRPAPEVVEAVLSALREDWANPSSVHRAGQAARRRVELAREETARLLGCEPREVVFTSGGTESTNLVLRGLSIHNAHRRAAAIITSRIEHAATRETAERLQRDHGVEILWTPLTSEGTIDPDALAELLHDRRDDIAVVSIQWINNETGAIQPIEAIGTLCREAGVPFHCDGTQILGKLPVNLAQVPLDLMTFSFHKFHGPKGVGGLYVAPPGRGGVRINPEITGGPQERERRGGTENTPGILGAGAAASLAREWLQTEKRSQIEAMRDRFDRVICARIGDARINQDSVLRIWSTTNIAFPRLEAEAILLLLSERGVYASAGAACSSGSLDPSPVLLAMGIPPEFAHGSIRFSLSRYTTVEEVDRALEVVPLVIERLQRSLAPR